MRQKKGVFNFDVKVCNDRADITSTGRLFHGFVAATGKARSPIVRSNVIGRDSGEVEDEQGCTHGYTCVFTGNSGSV